MKGPDVDAYLCHAIKVDILNVVAFDSKLLLRSVVLVLLVLLVTIPHEPFRRS